MPKPYAQQLAERVIALIQAEGPIAATDVLGALALAQAHYLAEAMKIFGFVRLPSGMDRTDGPHDHGGRDD